MKIIRKIWFKAKRADNEEWVKGFYIYNYDIDKHYISIGHCYLDEPERTKQYEIIPETLCQCTGIYDKNGEWIWENDIAEFVYDGDVYIYKIVWDESELDFKGTNGKENYGRNFNYLLCCEEIVVIGNSFDNPAIKLTTIE